MCKICVLAVIGTIVHVQNPRYDVTDHMAKAVQNVYCNAAMSIIDLRLETCNVAGEKVHQ